MKTSFKLFLALAVSVWVAPVVSAKMTSEEVLNTLHKTNQHEIHMGLMAQEKGSSDYARDYGKMLVNDHQDADAKVKDIAVKHGISLKTARPGMFDEVKMKTLQNKVGADFDRKFAEEMIDAHKKDIAKLQDAQKDPLNQDVKDLVAALLPKLQKHLEEAQRIYGKPS